MDALFQNLRSELNKPDDDSSLPPGLAKQLEALGMGGAGNSGETGDIGKKLAGMDAELGKFWSHLNSLAENDPKGYQDFLKKQTEEALSGQANKASGKGVNKRGKQGDVHKAATLICHTKMRNAGSATEREAAVHFWRAPPGAKYPAAPTIVEGGKKFTQVDFREKRPPFQQPLPDNTLAQQLIYSIEVHTEALQMALEEHACMTVVLEEGFAWIENHRQVQLKRDGRRLLTHREDLPEKAKLTALASAAASSLDSKASGAGSGGRLHSLSPGILHDIATMGKPQSEPAGGSGQQGGRDRNIANPSTSCATSARVKKPLIQDLGTTPAEPFLPAQGGCSRKNVGANAEGGGASVGNPDTMIRVIKGLDGHTPVRVEIDVVLSELKSAADANLEVVALELCLRIGQGEEYRIPLPADIPVDSDSIRAKFDKKRRCLKITMPATTA